MELKLKRPIAFFDLETTGINVAKDRITEIAILKISPNGKQESLTMRINPTIPISPEAVEITGITDDDLKDCPKFPEVGKEIYAFIDGCDLGGYNSNRFDIPLLAEEFLRADIDFDLSKRRHVDVQVIFHKMEQRTLSAAYKFYCGKELTNAHAAEADTLATYEVLKGQLDMYSEELENDIDKLDKFSKQSRNVDFAGKVALDENDVEVFNFGKHKGVPVREVFTKEPNYYKWMMGADFPLYTKKILTGIKLKMSFGK